MKAAKMSRRLSLLCPPHSRCNCKGGKTCWVFPKPVNRKEISCEWSRSGRTKIRKRKNKAKTKTKQNKTNKQKQKCPVSFFSKMSFVLQSLRERRCEFERNFSWLTLDEHNVTWLTCKKKVSQSSCVCSVLACSFNFVSLLFFSLVA